MRIVVTGAAGFIGSTLAEALVEAGHEIVGIDAFIPYYPREVKEWNLQALRVHPRFRFEEVDLRTADLDACLEGADAVIHEAAMAGLMRSWTDLDLYTSCNILATNRLIEAAGRAGVRRFVLASTSSVYGQEAVGDEDRPLEPSSPYGITKLACEKLVAAHVAMSGFPATIIRYFSIYGPRQRPDMAYHRFIEAMLDDRPITVYGDGKQTRSNTYVDDAVRGTIAAMERGEIGGIYNIGGGRTIALDEAIAIIANHLGVTPTIVREPARPGDQRHTSADIGRARRALGYEPVTDPVAGLGRQVDWHRARRAGIVSGS
ncbi:MAG: NAD-dependent epimerase/dehydratase family protein [Chloroflexota bacterium]